MKKVVLATNNLGKQREFQDLFDGVLSLVPQTVLGVSEVAETGMTFIENALIKARHAARLTGLPAVADDSGLEVAALNGAPGVYSARYAQGTHQTPIEKLLRELASIPSQERAARFCCVIVYLNMLKILFH